jgi:hypothetical protein
MRHIWIIPSAILAAAACGGDPGSGAGTGSEPLVQDDTELSVATHLLAAHSASVSEEAPAITEAAHPATAAPELKDDATAAATTTGGPHLQYFGGPVISKINVIPVYWGKGVKEQSTIESFFPAITNSAYIDFLKQYDTKTQSIERGTGSAAKEITPTITKKSLTDHDIERQLSIALTNKVLPAVNENNLYMVYFPPGFSISSQGGQSCVDFCAYHSTFKKGGKAVFYGVVPDLGSGGCESGCGNSTSQAKNTTEVSSHEMAEAITDADVGLATTIGNPLAWYDPTNGEIGDICVGEPATVAGFTVQKLWSNKANACVKP